MAKIIYYKSPLNKSEKIEINKQFSTLKDVLEYLKIQNEPLMVKFNGEIPDDLPLDLELEGSDTIEIHRPVMGGNNASNKETLATVIQIAALVAVIVFSGGAGGLTAGQQLGILLGSSLASGALMKRAAEIRAKAANSGTSIEEVDTATNSYSLDNIQNEARPTSTMPLPMGSHRSAPDLITDPWTSNFGQEAVEGEGIPAVSSFYPGVGTLTGGKRNGSLKRWADMPANYITTGFPKYAIRIAPFHYNTSLPITSTEEADIIADVKNEYLTYGTSLTAHWLPYSPDFMGRYSPLVIYHSDPTDPAYGKYNLFFYLAKAFYIETTYSYAYSTLMSNLFSGGSVGAYEDLYWTETHLSGNQELIKVTSSYNYFYPSTVGASETFANLRTKMANFLSTLNGGDLTDANKNFSYAIEMQYKTVGITSIVSEGVDYSTQIFNHGIGDFNISERKVGSIAATETIDSLLPTYSPIDKDNPVEGFRWLVPDLANTQVYYPFYQNVKAIERKQIKNLYDDYVFPGLFDVPSYIQFEGKMGQNAFNMNIEGMIYSTSGGGITTNNTQIIIEFKKSSEEDWSPYGSAGIVSIQNNNTKKLVKPIEIILSEGFLDTEKLMVRIRKTTLDENDNNGDKVCNLYADKIRFYTHYAQYGEYPDRRIAFAPQNQDGVSITALVNDSTTTTKYNALIEAKCWVFDFDSEEWVWQHTRNPAWWWLYLAHGGFLNLEAVGEYEYPYSPTFGWVNYPGHENSTEHIFGVGLTDDKIDISAIKEWAQFCDDEELTFDMIFKDDVSCSESLERIANAGRASCTYYLGLLSVIWEDKNQAVVGMYGMSDIIAGSFSINYQIGETPAKVIGKYINRETWETETVEASVPFSEEDNIQSVEINLEGITSTSLAQRAVNILAARQFYQKRSYSWDVGINGFLSRRGDIVYLSHDSTQYGSSGRIVDFIVKNNKITGIITNNAYLDSSDIFVTIKNPAGVMTNLSCSIDGNNILFDTEQDMIFGSWFYNRGVLNSESEFVNSQPEDFVFIAGAKETTGKKVRISSISPKDDLTFTVTAIDEDAAMWAREYDEVIDNESFDNSELVLKLDSFQYTDLGQGNLKIDWNGSEYIEIINQESNLPLEANGAYSFSGGSVIIELLPNKKYTLVARPFVLGQSYKSVEKVFKVWLS